MKNKWSVDIYGILTYKILIIDEWISNKYKRHFRDYWRNHKTTDFNIVVLLVCKAYIYIDCIIYLWAAWNWNIIIDEAAIVDRSWPNKIGRNDQEISFR
jgi:hypothetical protein